MVINKYMCTAIVKLSMQASIKHAAIADTDTDTDTSMPLDTCRQLWGYLRQLRMCILQFGATDSCECQTKARNTPTMPAPPPIPLLSRPRHSLKSTPHCTQAPHSTPRHTPLPCAIRQHLSNRYHNSIKIYILLLNNLLLLFVNLSLSLSLSLSLICCSC